MRYVIWSFEHRAWWRAGRSGYTEELEAAGRYTAEEAGEIVTGDVMAGDVAIEERTAERMGKPHVSSLWPNNER